MWPMGNISELMFHIRNNMCWMKVQRGVQIFLSVRMTDSTVESSKEIQDVQFLGTSSRCVDLVTVYAFPISTTMGYAGRLDALNMKLWCQQSRKSSLVQLGGRQRDGLVIMIAIFNDESSNENTHLQGKTYNDLKVVIFPICSSMYTNLINLFDVSRKFHNVYLRSTVFSTAMSQESTLIPPKHEYNPLNKGNIPIWNFFIFHRIGNSRV